MKTTWSWMVVAALIAVGCSDDTAQISTNNTNTNNGADAGADASQRPDAVVMVPKVVSIAIEPPTVTLVSSGTEVGQDFQLLATRDDGTTVPTVACGHALDRFPAHQRRTGDIDAEHVHQRRRI